MQEAIVIAVDAMGGDNAPHAIVKGCIRALQSNPSLQILLCGPEEELRALLSGEEDFGSRLRIVHAPDVISNHDAPVLAVKRKTASSLVVAMELVKAGEAKAVVSAGSTGAVLAGGILRVGRIPGIARPALAPIIPGSRNPFLLIDCGANVDCKPAHLVQFGLMGSVYMQNVLGVSSPRVALANIGAEDEKGNELCKATFPLMQGQPYRFTGNIEARDIPSGAADVVVADGFVGNIILKLTEGMALSLMGMLKEEMLSGTRTKMGAMLLKPALRNFKRRMDADEYGGAPLLGVLGAVVKAHGSSGEKALQSALKQAASMVTSNVVASIEQGVQNAQTIDKQ